MEITSNREETRTMPETEEIEEGRTAWIQRRAVANRSSTQPSCLTLPLEPRRLQQLFPAIAIGKLTITFRERSTTELPLTA